MNIKLKLILLELLSLLALSVILISGSLMLSVGEINVRVEETLRTAVFGFHGNTSYLRERRFSACLQTTYQFPLEYSNRSKQFH